MLRRILAAFGVRGATLEQTEITTDAFLLEKNFGTELVRFLTKEHVKI